MAALALAVLSCWGRGYGYRRAAIILSANWLVQVGCQLGLGDASPAWIWLWLDLVTALAIAFCPWAGRSHAVIATILGFQVLVHLAFHVAGSPLGAREFYLALTGLAGWGQLATLVGGAWHGPMRRTWLAWTARGRLAPAVDRRGAGMEARQ